MNWNRPALRRFWQYVSARQYAFYRRFVLNHDPPWTYDPIIASNQFTNVYRELDPGTRWLRRNVLENEDISPKDRGFLTVAYRLFGTEEIFEALGVQGGYPVNQKMLSGFFSATWLEQALEERMEMGKAAFTTAYLVSACNSSDPKARTVATSLNVVAGSWPAKFQLMQAAPDRKTAWKMLTANYGIGVFVGFQSLVDMCYDTALGKLLPFSNNDWIYAGTSATYGLKTLLGVPVDAKLKPGLDNEACAALVAMQREELDRNGMRWLLDARSRPILLDRSNIQNCVCEFGKYEKVRLGKRSGRLRTFDAQAARSRDKQAHEATHDLSGPAVQTDLTDLCS